MEIDKVLADLRKDMGDRAFKASEAPNVKVISTGIMSLDIATGVGGYPRGTLVEIFGRESAGKTALLLYAMAQVHRNNGFTALINLESGITQEGWLKWATSIAPAGFDPARLVIVNAMPGTEALIMFGKLISSGAFDIIGYDSIGAMSTDKELKIGEAKQAYGQSALVTQLIKQAAHYAYEKQCVPIMLNQIRDDAAGQYILEKAPGGHAKDHFATLRIHLKTSNRDAPKGKIDGEDTQLGFRVNARIVKNKVGVPRRTAGWNYWNYPSPDGVVGIDTFQDAVDCALRYGAFKRAGAWYYHDEFPDGKLNGGVAVAKFMRDNPQLTEQIRRDLVMQMFNNDTVINEEHEVLADAI
jgi:recombination protein RecA